MYRCSTVTERKTEATGGVAPFPRGEETFFWENVTKEQVQEFETRELIDKMYDGGADRLVASLLNSQKSGL